MRADALEGFHRSPVDKVSRIRRWSGSSTR